MQAELKMQGSTRVISFKETAFVNDLMDVMHQLRYWIHSCYDQIPTSSKRCVSSGVQPTAPLIPLKSPSEATNVLLDLISKAEELIQVKKQTRPKKKSKTENTIELPIPDGSYENIAGKNQRYLKRMSKVSGAEMEVIDMETVRITYSTEKQLKKANELLQQAINNFYVVFEHPEEAYILLKGVQNILAEISFNKYNDPRNEKRELLAINSLLSNSNDDERSNDIGLENNSTSIELFEKLLQRQDKKLVKGRMFIDNHCYNDLLARFTRTIENVSSQHFEESNNEKKNAKSAIRYKKFKVGLFIGKQLFYNAAKSSRKFNESSKVPVKEFVDFEIGTNGDIKTEFMNSLDPNCPLVPSLIDYLEERSLNKSTSESITIYFVDLANKRRMAEKCLIPSIDMSSSTVTKSKQLIVSSLSYDRRNHFYISFTLDSKKLDYRLKLTSKSTIITENITSKIKDKELKGILKWLRKFEWDYTTNTIIRKETKRHGKLFELDTIFHNKKTKYQLDEDTIITATLVSSETQDKSCYEVFAKNLKLKEQLQRLTLSHNIDKHEEQKFSSYDVLFPLINEGLLQKNTKFFDIWSL